MRLFLSVLLLSLALASASQSACTTAGQTPSTAFPVCGTAVFEQASVPLCGGRVLPSPACSRDNVRDVNPFWYKFTCFQAGTLGFLIEPQSGSSDYDWELFDVTGRVPDDVYTDGNLVVSSNWSGETGNTGASAAGSQTFVCAGRDKPLFSKMPSLQAGHNYLLLVSHFTNSQSGYKLSFGGGTAAITDTTEPHLKKALATCGGDVLRLKLNKKMRCNSIAGNGSEFFVTPAVAAVSSAAGIGCSAQFDTDSLEVKLSAFLLPGNYILNIRKGSDGNTLLDYCDRAVAETESLPFTVYPKAPTPMDSVAPPACAPTEAVLVFRRPMLCSSVAADGSDFAVSGSYPVGITGARGGACTNGVSTEVVVSLSRPLQTAGSFGLALRRGTDGNTLVDECGEETPAGAVVSFSVADTVNASFTYAIRYGCTLDTVNYLHPGGNGVNQWSWRLGEGLQSAVQNPQALYAVFNQKTVRLAVSNGVCRDTAEQAVMLENFLKADFSVYEDNCPNEPVPFASAAVGKIVRHQWDFGDGGTGNGANPSHVYPVPFRQTTYAVRYTVTDSFGCTQTARRPVVVYPNCYLAVPTAFTPNGDGLNDVFGVANAVKAENLQFVVFNRWGQRVYQTINWKQGWDGRVNGVLQPTGVFVWFLRYTDRDTGQRREQKGTVALIR